MYYNINDDVSSIDFFSPHVKSRDITRILKSCDISVALFEEPLYKIIETKDCLTDIE
jgi:hypothetical protein